jgi:hypothetical protein
MDKGYANSTDLNILIDENPELNYKISEYHKYYVSSQEFEDFDISHSSYFLLEGETPEPTGTKGSTGVRHGLRICLVLPDGANGGLSEEQKSKLRENNDFMSLAAREKTYLYEDGTLVVPLVTTEVDLVDSKISEQTLR